MKAKRRPVKTIESVSSGCCKLLINNFIACLKIHHMLITLGSLVLEFVLLFSSPAPALAEYILILKNGRQVNVETYKEEGNEIVFTSYGGEIRIAKEDVESIIPAVEGLATREVAPEPELAPGLPPAPVPGEERLVSPGLEERREERKDESPVTKLKALTPEEIKAAERAEEENRYRTKVKEITGRLRALRAEYAVASRRSPGPDPSILDSPEAIKARTADLNSRLKDAARAPAGPSSRGAVRLERPSPFTGAPPTAIDLRPGSVQKRVRPPLTPYSPKEEKLSQLRRQILTLEKDRDRLIQEMRDRNFNTASLFLD